MARNKARIQVMIWRRRDQAAVAPSCMRRMFSPETDADVCDEIPVDAQQHWVDEDIRFEDGQTLTDEQGREWVLHFEPKGRS
jgi:hypothetical protein